MSLDANTIKARLEGADWIVRDNEAQNIIQKAKVHELSSLDVESILRLYEALALQTPRVYSRRDQLAINRLRVHTQFQLIKNSPGYAVNLIRHHQAGVSVIQSQLTPGLVTRIYQSEKSRLSFLERHGIDGDTIGRGQLSQLAYQDVKSIKHFKNVLEKYIPYVFIPELLGKAPFWGNTHRYVMDFNNYQFKVPEKYSQVYKFPPFEDFVVAAYLAIRIKVASKPGRSDKDAVRFAVAIYHGMYNMVFNAQKAVGNTIDWAPVEAELIKQGHTDQVDYVNEVVL